MRMFLEFAKDAIFKFYRWQFKLLASAFLAGFIYCLGIYLNDHLFFIGYVDLNAESSRVTNAVTLGLKEYNSSIGKNVQGIVQFNGFLQLPTMKDTTWLVFRSDSNLVYVLRNKAEVLGMRNGGMYKLSGRILTIKINSFPPHYIYIEDANISE
jgi:hypothetical protein